MARVPGQFVAIRAPLNSPAPDVRLTGVFHKAGGPPGGGYGLVLRDQGPGPRDGRNQLGRFYVAEVGDQGDIGIWRREQDHWVDLVPWTRSATVGIGSATNEVQFQANGHELSLLVNGRMAARVDDAALDVGSLGVFVGGDGNEVIIHRLTVQAASVN